MFAKRPICEDAPPIAGLTLPTPPKDDEPPVLAARIMPLPLPPP